MGRATSGATARGGNDGMSNETQYWSQAVDALTELIERRNSPGPRDTLAKVNRSIADFSTELETEAGYEQFKITEKKFIHGLEELRDGARKDVELIDTALRRLEMIIALRNVPDAPISDKKRNNRLRLDSPASASASSTASQIPHGRAVSGPSAGMSAASAGPSGLTGTGKNRKAQHSGIMDKLEVGRKVAYHQPAGIDPATGEGRDSQWILVKFKRQISAKLCEVEDADEEGALYHAGLDSLILLPDPSFPNLFPDYPSGTRVLGLYPDTTSFYRATILEGPRRFPAGGGARTVAQAKADKSYKVRFDDDTAPSCIIPAFLVMPIPPG